MQSQPQSTNAEPALLPVPAANDPLEGPPALASAVRELPLPHGLTKKRLALAFAIAAVSDVISAFTTFMPPVEWVVDLVTAALLFIVLGWHWLLLPGLIMEAIPGVGVVPFWVLVVGAIAVWGTVKPKLN